MVKINDLIALNEKSMFDGAVQLDWVYDKKMRELVSSSYVFHGPKYHGVTKDDIGISSHKLVDSATFVNEISKKLYENEDGKNFVMAIANYGTGKSHLAVTMSTMFSEGRLGTQTKSIINNIKLADKNIGIEIENAVQKPNLIIAINGNKQANLNSLVLSAAKEALSEHHISHDVLKGAGANIKTAKHFIDKSFKISEKILARQTEKIKKIHKEGNDLKEYLLEKVEYDVEIFEIINEAYKEFTGNYIRMEDTSSAGAILITLNKELIEERKIFNKILVVFDEFGGFIEFAAQRPTVAGDSSLQQIYESVQNGKNNIIFIGFIQAELQTYIARVVDNPNIEKYLSRYRTSHKYYLSSNLETIFANLLVKNLEQYKIYVENFIDTGLNSYNERIHKNLKRWLIAMKNKNVWNDYNRYKEVILKGCYPFHPLSIWILSNLSSWMQDRSTIVYFAEAFERKKNMKIDKGDLKLIYPKDLISDSFIAELKSAEDIGLQQSQYCNLYYNIISEFRNKINEDEIDVLKAILIINILNFKCMDRTDLNKSLEYCTGFDYEKLNLILKKLENDYGVILFNPQSNQYEFSIQANGKSEYLKTKLLKSYNVNTNNILDILENDKEISERLSLSEDIKTHFGDTKNINSTEWNFAKKVIDISEITQTYINSLIGICNRSIDGNSARGIVLYVYCNNFNSSLIDNVKELIKETEVYKYPIVFYLFKDDRELYNALKEKLIISKFDLNEQQRFAKHYNDDNKIINKKIQKYFTILMHKRQIITKDGVISIDKRLVAYCEDLLHQIYDKAVSFCFDGLEKKITPKIKYYLEVITKGLINGEFENEIKVSELPSDIKNRLNSLFGIRNSFSWKCLNENKFLIKSQNESINAILEEINEKLEFRQSIKGITLFKKYLEIPYGMNKYSINVLIAYFIFINRNRIRLYDGKTRVKLSDIAGNLFTKKSQEDKLFQLNYVFTEEGSSELFENLVKEIQSLVFVSECLKYKEKINRIKQEVELDAKQLGILKDLEYKVKEGINLGQQENKFIKEINDLFNNLDNYVKLGDINALTSIGNIINKINKYKLIFKNSSSFNLSDSGSNFILENNKKVIEFFAGDFLNILENLKSDSYSNWVKKKPNIINLIKIFKTNNYKNESNLLKEKCDRIEKQLQFQEKNKELLAQINTMLKFNSNFENRSNNELEYQLNECLKYISKIESSGLENKKYKIYIEKINEHINKIEKELNKRENILEKLIYKFDCIVSTDELNKYYDLVNEKKALINDDKVKKVLYNISEEIYTFKNDIDKLVINNRDEFIKEVLNLEQKYKFKTTFLNIIKSYKIDTLNKLNEKNDIWMEKTLIPIQSNISEMTVDEVKFNIRKLYQYPHYLNKDTISKLNIITKKLEQKLDEFEVEGIVASFKELSEEQQFECFNKIRSIFKEIV